MQRAAFDATTSAISIVGETKVGMEKWSKQDLQNARHSLERDDTADQIYAQFADALSKEYADVLLKHLSR